MYYYSASVIGLNVIHCLDESEQGYLVFLHSHKSSWSGHQSPCQYTAQVSQGKGSAEEAFCHFVGLPTTPLAWVMGLHVTPLRR